MSEVGAPGAGAPAPASSPTPAQSTPLPDRGASPPNPATSSPAAPKDETTVGQPPPRKSIDDAIKDAAVKVEAKQEAKDKAEPKPQPKPEAKAKPDPSTKAQDKVEPKAEAKPSRERDDGGRFASTQPKEAEPQDGEAPHHQPPHRFSAEAKAEWANAPETVKAETHRAMRELEVGYHKYRADAEAYNEVRSFDQLARQTGTTLSKALANYVTIERDLASGDPQAIHSALQRVFQRAQVDPRQWAAHVLGQPPEAREAEQYQAYNALKSEIAGLKQELQGVVQDQQQTQTDAISQKVTSFAQSQPRFDELSAPDIEHSIQNLLKIPGMVPPGPPEQRLQKAYELADRLNPGANGRQASFSPEPRPANGAGTKSIAGSPANGSDPTLPAKKGKHPSIDEALKRAAARYG